MALTPFPQQIQDWLWAKGINPVLFAGVGGGGASASAPTGGGGGGLSDRLIGGPAQPAMTTPAATRARGVPFMGRMPANGLGGDPFAGLDRMEPFYLDDRPSSPLFLRLMGRY